jgi:hypothetical protein
MSETYSTYSFEDISCVFHHPSMGSQSITGQGVGSITIGRSNDNTVHDIAADGSVMISKINAKNGTITIECQQTSKLNDYLVKWHNYVEGAASSEWARMTVTVTSKNMNQKTTCSYVSPQRPGDRPYQAQGQKVSWTLMAGRVIFE